MADSWRGSLAVLLAAALVGSAACSTAVHSAADAAGEEVGEAAGEAAVGEYAPEFRQWYVGYLTRLAFFSGGYSLAPATHDYEPGDFTVYRVNNTNGERVAQIERALLFVDDEGNEGWKVKFLDHENNDTTIVEMLFSPERDQLLRMRARFPDEAKGQEMPVRENDYYEAPDRLTEESVEGATVGTERITVPAGTFEARHVQYGVPGTSGTQDWWLIDEVPGGIVRYVHEVPGEDQDDDEPESAAGLDADDYVLELVDYGTGAESEIGLEP